ILRNEVEAMSDPTPAEIITIKVISGFASTRNGLMLRVSDFPIFVSAVQTALDVKISLLAFMRSLMASLECGGLTPLSPSRRGVDTKAASSRRTPKSRLTYSAFFVGVGLRRVPALLPACAASA